jgi:hypothetical protein
MANPTIRDTKQTILNAYKDLQTKMKNSASQTINPTQEAKVKKAKATIGRANGIPDVSNIQSFQNSFVDSMQQFTTNFSDLLGDFNDIKESIELKKSELQELFGIENEAFTLAALIDAQRVNKEEYTENIKQTHIEAEQRLNDKKMQINMEIVTAKGDLEKARQATSEFQERSRVEFDYSFSREQRNARDQLDDEIANKRKDYQSWANTQNATIADQKDEISKREEAIAAQESEVAELRLTVQNVPSVIAESVKNKVAKAKGAIEATLKAEKALIEAENKGVVQVLKSEKLSLETSNDSLKSQVTDMTNKLENAYKQLRDLASDTVKGPSMAAMVSEVKKQSSQSTR